MLQKEVVSRVEYIEEKNIWKYSWLQREKSKNRVNY